MKIQIEKISESVIKPSSPTPNHLRRCLFSSLDQMMYRCFQPLLFFYPRTSTTDNAEKLQMLRTSLSETLTLFYPLAGRLVGNSHVDCNDEGVPLVEAKAKGSILEILETPYSHYLNEFVPFDVFAQNDLAASVQVTYFECGGMVIGTCISHKFLDALSLVVFFNTWAGVARGGGTIDLPRFDAANYFKPLNISEYQLIMKNENHSVSRRFIFSQSSISALKHRYTVSGGMTKQPTRVEILTAFIFIRYIATVKREQRSADTTYVVKHVLNLRPRMKPLLSNQHMGNIFDETVVAVLDTKEKDPFSSIIYQMREYISNVDAEFVKKIQDGEVYKKMMNERAKAHEAGNMVALSFSSLLGFPLYATDFGWGKPVFTGTAHWPQENQVYFFDTKEGDIMAYVHLNEEAMARFEKDLDIASFTSPTPFSNPSKL